MALITVAPGSDGSTIGTVISVTGAATRWQALATNDGDTSYVKFVFTTGGSCTAHCGFSSPTLLGAATIISVTPYAVAKYVGAAANFRVTLNFSTGLWYGASTALTAAYATYSEIRTTRPVTGTPWQPGDMATLEFGTTTVSAPEMRFTQTYIIVEYLPAAGFWASLVSSLFGPMVGVGMAHAAGLARALREKAGTWPTSGEYADFIREIREGRYAKHFILGRT